MESKDQRVFKSEMGTMKGKETKELGKNTGEELLKSERELLGRGHPAPSLHVHTTRYTPVRPVASSART